MYSTKQMLLLPFVFLIPFAQCVLVTIMDGGGLLAVFLGVLAGTLSLTFILIFLYFEGYRFLDERI